MRGTTIAVVLALLAALAGCSKPPPDGERDDPMAVHDQPGVAPTAAPGVAFNYRYDFRLAGNRIAAVQEAHAQACEKLGIARCRITGMRYRLVNARDVSGMLAFKLDPAIARAFGKQGIAAAQSADGMLIDSEISGTDAGQEIADAARDGDALRHDLDAAERTVASARGAAAQAAQAEAERLRGAIRDAAATRATAAASLASTPMVFNYGSGDLIPGFDARSPLHDALSTAGENAIWSIGIIVVVVASILPLLLFAALLAWLYDRHGRRALFYLGLKRDNAGD